MLSRLLALIALLPALLVPCAVRVCLCTGERASGQLECCASCCVDDAPDCCAEPDPPPLAPGDRSAAKRAGADHSCCLTLASGGDWVAAAARTEPVAPEPLAAAASAGAPAPLASARESTLAARALAPPPRLAPAQLVRGSGLPLLI